MLLLTKMVEHKCQRQQTATIDGLSADQGLLEWLASRAPPEKLTYPTRQPNGLMIADGENIFTELKPGAQTVRLQRPVNDQAIVHLPLARAVNVRFDPDCFFSSYPSSRHRQCDNEGFPGELLSLSFPSTMSDTSCRQGLAPFFPV